MVFWSHLVLTITFLEQGQMVFNLGMQCGCVYDVATTLHRHNAFEVVQNGQQRAAFLLALFASENNMSNVTLQDR